MNYRIAATLAALAAAGAALAQEPRRAGPAEASANAPNSRYDSVFTGYRRYQDEPIAPWREANDEMRRLGGHVGHVPGTATPSVPAPGAAPKPAPHHGHGGKK